MRGVAELDDIQALWFEGSVWCKAFGRGELERAARPGSKTQRAIEAALAGNDSEALLSLTVSTLLVGQMRESSSHAAIESARWRASSLDVVRERAESLSTRGCETSASALAWFVALEGDAFVLDSEVEALGVVTESVIALYFDAG